jgi:hypothetical protein
MRPMNEFDPAKPGMVHDRINDRTFEWAPETMQANYNKYASPRADGVTLPPTGSSTGGSISTDLGQPQTLPV